MAKLLTKGKAYLLQALSIYNECLEGSEKQQVSQSNIKLHVLTTSSKLNNTKRANIVLESEDDEWQVLYSIAEKSPNLADYHRVREIRTETKPEKESALIREIKSKYMPQEREETPREQLIVGDWAIPSK